MLIPNVQIQFVIAVAQAGPVIVETQMTIHEARVKGRKLLLQKRKVERNYNKQKFHLNKALRELHRHCPHDLVRDEDHIQYCAACGKEFE